MEMGSTSNDLFDDHRSKQISRDQRRSYHRSRKYDGHSSSKSRSRSPEHLRRASPSPQHRRRRRRSRSLSRSRSRSSERRGSYRPLFQSDDHGHHHASALSSSPSLAQEQRTSAKGFASSPHVPSLVAGLGVASQQIPGKDSATRRLTGLTSPFQSQSKRRRHISSSPSLSPSPSPKSSPIQFIKSSGLDFAMPSKTADLSVNRDDHQSPSSLRDSRIDQPSTSSGPYSHCGMLPTGRKAIDVFLGFYEYEKRYGTASDIRIKLMADEKGTILLSGAHQSLTRLIKWDDRFIRQCTGLEDNSNQADLTIEQKKILLSVWNSAQDPQDRIKWLEENLPLKMDDDFIAGNQKNSEQATIPDGNEQRSS